MIIKTETRRKYARHIKCTRIRVMAQVKSFKFESGNFNSLSCDLPFVVNYNIENDNFVALLTTKNCLQNFVKQASNGYPLICLDGTYKNNIPESKFLILIKFEI